MKKILLAILVMFALTGCGSSSPAKPDETPAKTGKMPISQLRGGVIRSVDGGVTYESSVAVSAKKNLSKVNMLSLVCAPPDCKSIYAGSADNGLFVSRDMGDSWEHVASFAAVKAYAIAVHPTRAETVYASGVADKRAKVFKTEDAGKTWKEIYTEPSDGTVILSLALDRRNPETIYVGTSTGVTVKTTNGGSTWQNLTKVSGPVSSITVDSSDSQTIFVILHEGGVTISRDGGKSFHSPTEGKILDQIADPQKKDSEPVSVPTKIYSMALDPQTPGTIYFGSDDGIYRARQYGEKWEKLNIIQSSSAYPIRALAVSPKNSQQLIYASARALYRTLDGGTNWSVYQLESDAGANVMVFNPYSGRDVFIGLKS